MWLRSRLSEGLDKALLDRRNDRFDPLQNPGKLILTGVFSFEVKNARVGRLKICDGRPTDLEAGNWLRVSQVKRVGGVFYPEVQEPSETSSRYPKIRNRGMGEIDEL